MARNGHPEMRACSLPPENAAPEGGFYPPKSNQNGKVEHLYQKNPNNSIIGGKIKLPNRADLDLPEDVFPGSSDYDPSSPASVEVANGNSKHSPSDCSSAFTDEDSGCQMYYFGNALRVGPKCRMGRAWSITALDSPSIQPFHNRDEFLAAMTEDLSDWMSRLYPEIAKDLDPENFFDRISDGVLLCHHATELHRLLDREFPAKTIDGERRLEGIQIGGVKPVLPPNPPTFQSRNFNANLAGGSFWARNNVANFIQWCRAMHLPDCILFETEDLVSKKNLRSVIVCLLELARLGGRVGMEVPEIVYLEKEIDNEIALRDRAFKNDCETATLDLPSFDWSGDTHGLVNKTSQASTGTEEEVDTSDAAIEVNVSPIPQPAEKSTENRPTKASLLREKKIKDEMEKRKREEALKAKQLEEEEAEKAKKPRYNRPVIDMRTLDEIVREKLAQCTCEQTFPMIRLSEGRYLFGDKSTQIFVRILRNHVMVRVGGGWDTLDHFLQRYDECRKVQQPNSPSTNDKRSLFKKSHSHSVDNGILDTSNKADLVNAVSGGNRQSGAKNGDPTSLLAEGNLKVTKKGREVVYTTAEVVHQSPSKCNINHHCSKFESEPIKEAEVEEKQLTPSSSIEDLVLTPVIKRVERKPGMPALSSISPAGPLDHLIQIGPLDGKESTLTHRESTTVTDAHFASSNAENIQTIPVIDQVVSGFDEAVKPLHIADPGLEKSQLKPKLKSSPLPSPYKTCPNSPDKKMPISSSSYSVNRQKAISTHNLTSIGRSAPRSNLGKFSQSTASLNGPSAVRRAGKPLNSQPTRNTTLSANQRAKSVSNISTNLNTNQRSRQPVGDSKTDVFERLSANPKRNTTTPKIVTPAVTHLKSRNSIKQTQPETNKAPIVRRRSSVNIIKKIAIEDDKPTTAKSETQKLITQSGSTQVRRSSVARMPAEGSRIPRPAKLLTVSEARSKSVGPNAYPNCSSVA
ncbi:hypothetical protein Aperf_G00000077306 [Anoplocephala perfoliata]